MISLSLMISYIKHCQYSAKSKYFGPFYYIQIDPPDYDEWRTSPPEEEIHFQTPSKFGSPTTPQSTVSSEASESYITLTNFKKGIKRDASAYPIFKNERYYNTFIQHFKATAKAQGLNSLMDPNFTPGSDEHEQQLFQEQQDFLYSVLISSLKTEFSEALVKDHEGDAQLILELLHEHHTGKQLKEETRYDVQMYTSLGPMMRMHTKTYPLMTIKSYSKRMFARATSKAHPHPTLRRSSFPNLSGKSS